MVLYHAGVTQLSGGYVGVDVFFVISGFLITSHLVSEVEATRTLDIARFYGRRMLRLLPAAAAVLVATLVATWMWLPATRLTSISHDAIAANLYVLNYRQAASGADYSNITAAPSPLQHFWSLAVEEQFYLVIPLLLIVTMVVERSRTAFAAVVGLITATSLAWSIYSSARSPIWAYYGAPTRAWELGLGALLALAAPSLIRRFAGGQSQERLGRSVLPPVIATVGLTAIALAALRFDDQTTFPGWAALVPTLGAVLVLGAGILAPLPGLDIRSLQAIGARSYSWYLWHWPVLVIAPFVVGHQLGVTGNLISAGAAYLLASLSFGLLEHPLRTNPGLRDHPIRALGTGLGLTSAVIVLALMLPVLPSHIAQGTGHAEPVKLAGSASAKAQALTRKLSTAAVVKDLPKNLTPSLKDAATDDPSIVNDGCLLGYAQTKTALKCENYGSAKSSTVIVLFGDSHAAQWFPAMEIIAKKRHWRLAVFTKIVCSVADVKIYLDATKGYTACMTWRQNSITQINELHPAIILATNKVDGNDAIGFSGDESQLDQDWGDALGRTLDHLKAANQQLVYLDDTPTPKEDVPDCLSQHPRNIPTCAQNTRTANTTGRRSAMLKTAQEHGATKIISPAKWFCTPKTCPVVVGNTLVYRDASHITGAYTRLVAPLLSEQLAPPVTKKKKT